ncbi:hypothetical protein BU26DRAFT_104720 [Trematosphaeria pertusa]|uniref:Secreted protein n=1 Tax=Trematosphaeria pertusa TaxID=390896 RepID=A0A6A6I0S9_9PLEO|nr:uncharacterized protein BU26DRAFT_104720 [Trematosphaeria pertusa]KAF2243582.1 hypothetical protein BU26DRAFT_104720 [Trematosphaeria pertusa]
MPNATISIVQLLAFPWAGLLFSSSFLRHETSCHDYDSCLSLACSLGGTHSDGTVAFSENSWVGCLLFRLKTGFYSATPFMTKSKITTQVIYLYEQTLRRR